LRRDSEEVVAIMPLHGLLIYQAEISLMDESSGLKRMIDTFAAQVGRRQSPEFVVDLRN